VNQFGINQKTPNHKPAKESTEQPKRMHVIRLKSPQFSVARIHLVHTYSNGEDA